MAGEALAVCRDCTGNGDPVVVPFHTHVELDRWMTRHKAERGHAVKSVPGWPAPAVAWAKTWGAQ